MIVKKVFQTLNNLNNPSDIESDGPFICNREDAWLGTGFYFWDSFIQNAHWWGKACNYKNGYIICQAICDYSDLECFDLVDNTDNLMQLNEMYEYLISQKLADSNTKVSQVLEFIRKNNAEFRFTSVKAIGLNSKSFYGDYSTHLIFEVKKHNGKSIKKTLDLIPPIQICFYYKSSMNLREYKIVFPDEYVDGYVL